MITKKEILQYLHYNPLSKRTEIGRAQTVDSIDYKKAMLMFYEQNNIFVVGKRKKYRSTLFSRFALSLKNINCTSE